MIRFTKMHGAGNDFVCLDGVREPELAARGDLGALAAAMSRRHTGIGADGLILIGVSDPPQERAVRMRMFNTDGSESAMCGNGLRCVARYAVDHGLVEPDSQGRLSVQTGDGCVDVWCTDPGRVTVDMGVPALDLAAVPVERSRLHDGDGPAYGLSAGGARYEAVFVSMGNPHAVIYVDDVQSIVLHAVGPNLETHAAFPQRMNVHFVHVQTPAEVRVRTWERGSGATGACGSGACAVCVAGVLTGRTGRRLDAHLPAGDLAIDWNDQTDHVHMTGPAVEVFTGTWPEEERN